MKTHTLSVLALFLLAVIVYSKPPTTSASPTATLTLGATVISEGDDFATRVLGIPWDMNGNPYPDFPTTLKNVDRNTFSVSNGFWNMTATNNDARIWLLWTGIQNTQKVLRMGDRFPIDASKYKLLSFYMCSSADSFANVYWFYDRSPHDDPANGISNFLNVEAGCKLYVLELTQGASVNSWSGNVLGLRLDPVNSAISFQIKWVRLTTADTTNVVPLSWSGAPGGTLDFYISPTGCGANDGILIGSVDNAPSSGTFNWGSALQPNPSPDTPFPLPESLEPGQYYVYMLDTATGAVTCANSQLEIRQAPILVFHKPSFYSGPDYASQVVGDPWGMSNAQDVQKASNFSSLSFNNGILQGVTSSNDPQIVLRVTQPIDTSKYKYATFNFRVDGTQNVGQGWVQRFIWWYQGPTIDAVITEDMIIYEGWHRYTVDLSTAFLENGSWSGFPTTLRFDPAEPVPPLNLTIYLDYLTLTGDEIITSGDLFEIVYETEPAQGVTVTLYYDTDTNPDNGRTLIPPLPQQPSVGPFLLYLPVIKSISAFASEIGLPSGERAYWDTTGVPAGTYYISADVSDGVTTTTWYSELPVIIID